MKKILTAIVLVLPGCALERAATANNAQQQMVGLNKEQILSCMGTPAGKSSEGATEVWSYNSGGATTGSSYASTTGMATGVRTGNMFTASGSSQGFGLSRTDSLYCTVSIVMNGGHVQRVNYSGPTGGLITSGEQCAYAIRNCVQAQ